MTERELIDKYLGVPFLHKGRTMQGCDCYGFVILVYKDLGFDLFDLEKYDKKWSFKGKNILIENYHRQWKKIEKPATFDTVMFWGCKRTVDHGGIVLSDNRFIHCCKAGTVVARLEDQRWQNKVQGYYHLKARDK